MNAKNELQHEDLPLTNQDYQIIDKDNVLEFRKKVNEKLLSFIKENLPSLAESDKSLPPNDWIN